MNLNPLLKLLAAVRFSSQYQRSCYEGQDSWKLLLYLRYSIFDIKLELLHEYTATFHPIIAFRLPQRINNTVWLESLAWATNLDVKEFQSIHAKR
ncbi:hypothetical protein H6G04_33690 [Calothrix membranacea FACHB-236]|nr:hypothetical protein [Calothrix membranacea FACHB-236]